MSTNMKTCIFKNNQFKTLSFGNIKENVYRFLILRTNDKPNITCYAISMAYALYYKVYYINCVILYDMRLPIGVVELLQSWSTANDIKAFWRSELRYVHTSYKVNPDKILKGKNVKFRYDKCA